MKAFNKFRKTLFESLNSSEYVFLSPIPPENATNYIEILLQDKELQPIIDHLKQLPDLNSVTLTSSFQCSKVMLKFKDNAEMIINFVHQFAYKSLIYLDEEEVLERKVKDGDSFWIPCVEHIFEHFILKSFLNFQGIGKSVFQYFNEFHILVQEDLLDYFNMKYGTGFSNIYQLTDFNDQQREQIVHYLRQRPTNKLMKKINTQWHSFLGAMKQARVV